MPKSNNEIYVATAKICDEKVPVVVLYKLHGFAEPLAILSEDEADSLEWSLRELRERRKK